MRLVLLATLGALALVAAWAIYDALDRRWQLSRRLRRRFGPRRRSERKTGAGGAGRGPLNLLLVLVAAMALWVLAILAWRALAH